MASKKKFSFEASDLKAIFYFLVWFLAVYAISFLLIKFTFSALGWLDAESAKLIVTVVAGLVSLAVTNGVAILKSHVDHQLSLKKEIDLKRIELEEGRLSNFYDPICNLMVANEALFSEFSPKNFPDDYALAEEAGEVWKDVRQTILENNKIISEKIRNHLHLISYKDCEEKYVALLSHIISYNFYQRSVNENHSFRKFPTPIFEHIKRMRKDTKDNVEKMKLSLGEGV